MASSARRAQTAEGQNHERLHREERRRSLQMYPSEDKLPVEFVEISTGQQMLSATSGSLLTGLLMTPLDVVRVRWQAQDATPQNPAADSFKVAVPRRNAFRPSNLGVTACCREVFFMNNNTDACMAGPRIARLGGSGSPGPTCAVEEMQQRTFNSTLDGLRKIARNEGIMTLWRGLSPTLVMAIPGNIIYFSGYEWLRYNHVSPVRRTVRDEYAPLVAGSFARVLAAAAVSPIELFRTRMQALHHSSGNHMVETFRGVKDMVGAHGYRALWRGLTLTLWRDVPFSGMYWWGYEDIRGRLTDMRARVRGRPPNMDEDRQERNRTRQRSQSREKHSETFTDSFVAGALSGAIASVVTVPFDVGKTRTQVHGDTGKGAVRTASHRSGTAALSPVGTSMIRLLWHIFKTEGMPGLFKGWIPRTLKVAPACAIMISSYEVGKRAFRRVNERALLQERRQNGHDHS